MAKPVALIDDGKISGLAGTNNGDVLTWNSSTQAWESQAGGGGGGGSDWHLTGNAGTTPGTNYVGTSDAQELQIRTNNLEAIRVDTAQQVGINASGVTLTHAFEVHGSTHLNPTGGADTDIGNLANGGDVTIYAHQSNKTVDLQASAVNLQTAGAGTTTIGNTTSGGAVAIRTALAETATLAPGALTATLGTQTTGGTAGGAISMTAGAGATTGAGGAFNVTGGTGGATGAGGAVAVLGGTGGGTSGTGGAVTVVGGSAGASGATGGDVTVQAGAGNGAASGTLKLYGGTGSVASDAGTGSISILAGKNATIANRSGDVTIQGGYDATAATNVLPGRVNIFGGDTSFSANGKVAGSLVLRGGNNTGTGSGSNGGAVTIDGGSGHTGGVVTITSGTSSNQSTGPSVTVQGGFGSVQRGNVLVQGGSAIVRATSTSTSKGILLASTDTSGAGFIGVGIDGFICLSQGSETITTAATTLTPLRTYHAVTADVAGITTVRTISPGFSAITAGTVVIIFNAGTNSFTLTNTGGNIRMTSATAALPARGHIAFIYDGTNFREMFRNVATAITGTAA